MSGACSACGREHGNTTATDYGGRTRRDREQAVTLLKRVRVSSSTPTCAGGSGSRLASKARQSGSSPGTGANVRRLDGVGWEPSDEADHWTEL